MNIIIRQVKNGWVIEYQPGDSLTMQTWVAISGADVIRVMRLIFCIPDPEEFGKED